MVIFEDLNDLSKARGRVPAILDITAILLMTEIRCYLWDKVVGGEEADDGNA